MKIVYCGFARLYNQTCEQADFACSIPGPAFDVEAYKEIRVIWINNYTKPNIDERKANNSFDLVAGMSVNDCFYKNKEGSGCNKTAKFRKDSGLYMFDPTNKFPHASCPAGDKP